MYGLIGHNIGYTYSPLIHNLLGYEYDVYDLAENEVVSFLHKRDFKGVNVTIPYKQFVIPYLDYIDPLAKQLNAVNTIVNKDGKLYGYNTDFEGFKYSLKYHDVKILNKDVVILGTGATASSIEAVISSLHPQNIKKIGRSSKINYNNIEEVKDYSIMINTTPLGTSPNIFKSPIDINRFSSLECVIDVIYNPHETTLVRSGLNSNINSFGGLMMLVAQAVFSYELFFDKIQTDHLINKIYEEVLKMKQNIVLIGMPSAGKSTLGNLLSQKLQREFYDTDKMIVESENKTIEDIFTQDGEVFFRMKESSIINEVSVLTNSIIATGGGVILDSENIENLKKNGVVIFIDRPLDLLMETPDRPLSKSREDLSVLYEDRIEKYKEMADFTVVNDKSLDHAIERIIDNL